MAHVTDQILVSAVFTTGVQSVKVTPMSTAPLRLPSPTHSVNDGIPKELFLEHYMKVHSIIDRIMTHGERIIIVSSPSMLRTIICYA